MPQSLFKPRAEILEHRVTPATVYFHANTSNVWSDPGNWVLGNNAAYGQMPTTSDNVYIEDDCNVDNDSDIYVASLTINALFVIPSNTAVSTTDFAANAEIRINGLLSVTDNCEVAGEGNFLLYGNFYASGGVSVGGEASFSVYQDASATIGGTLQTTNASAGIFVRGGQVTANSVVNSATMWVNGTVNANISNSRNFVVGRWFGATEDVATATIAGNFSSTGANAVVTFFVDGNTSSSMSISGDLTASGTMTTQIANANPPAGTDIFSVIQYCGTRTGTFNGATFNMGGNPFQLAFPSTEVRIVPGNQAPINAVPGAVITPVNTAYTFSSGAISIADAEADTADVQVTLTATHGVLTLSGTTGLSFSFSDANGTGVGDGTDDATMTFRGSISDINTALDGLSFTPTSSYNGSATVQILTNDLGNTGAGGARTDDDTVLIDVGVPVVTALSQHSGSSIGGDSITITGICFTYATDVYFGGTSVSSFTVVSDTSITTTVPFSMFGGTSCDVTVVNPNGTSATSAASLYYYVNGAPSGADSSLYIMQTVDYTFSTADFNFSDIDANGFDGVKVTGLASMGGLYWYNGSAWVAVTQNQVISAADIAAFKLKYTPPPSTTGTATFTFRVRDDGGTLFGGIDLDTDDRTMTLYIS